MPRRPDRRAYRDAPFLDEHAASERRRRLEPRGFATLLAWFLAEFAAETPEAVHAAGVWFGRPGHDIPGELVGGSQLGAPKQAEPFRQLIENSPRQTAGDGADEHYVRPMRAALAALGRRGEDAPLMARYLNQVAYAQGDWRAVAARWFPAYPVVHRAFTEQALRRLLTVYRPDPPARFESRVTSSTKTSGTTGWTSLSEAQRTAIEAGERGVA